MNCVTACTPESARIPMYLDSDREVIDTAIKTFRLVKLEEARVVCITNTLQLEEMAISESMVEEARVMANITLFGRPRAMYLDNNKNLIFRLLSE